MGRLGPIDLINVMLGAILGATLGNSESFRPATFPGVLNCLYLVALIVLFVMNCQWTVMAVRVNNAIRTIVFALSFVALEVALMLYGVTFSNEKNSFSLKFNAQTGASIWVFCIVLAGIYVANVVSELIVARTDRA